MSRRHHSGPVSYPAGEGSVVDPELESPPDSTVGDVVIAVVLRNEPTVEAVYELVAGTDGPRLAAARGFTDFRGVSIRAVEQRLGQRLPRTPVTLRPDLADQVLRAIDAERRDRTPWYIVDWYRDDDGGCVAATRRSTAESGECECCGERFARAGEWDVSAALERHVVPDDDWRGEDPPGDLYMGREVRVCASCHAVLHSPMGPSAVELMFAWRPECPACGVHKTEYVIWGMPPGPPPPGTRVAGCVVDLDNGMPDCVCADCDYEWYSDPDEDPRPVWHRERSSRSRGGRGGRSP